MSRESLIAQYGIEIILRCECKDIPSHYMDGRAPTCPTCKRMTMVLFGANWEDVLEKYPR